MPQPSKWPEIFDTYYGEPGPCTPNKPFMATPLAESQETLEEDQQFAQNDANLTAFIIMMIAEILRPHFEDGVVTVGYNWRIRFEDIHDEDCGETPDNYHFCLEIGENHKWRSYGLEHTTEVRYCDNHPCGNCKIEQSPGKIKITATIEYLPENLTAVDLAAKAAKIYIKGMHKFFPEYGTVFFAPL